MNVHYSPYECIVRGRRVDLGAWYSDDDGRLLSDDELCEVCGRPCTEHDNDGNTIHDNCNADRAAMQAESQEDR